MFRREASVETIKMFEKNDCCSRLDRLLTTVLENLHTHIYTILLFCQTHKQYCKRSASSKGECFFVYPRMLNKETVSFW